MNAIIATATTTVELTPAMLAQAFWNMGTDGQAEFLEELSKQTRATYRDPDNKWAWMCGEEARASGTRWAGTWRPSPKRGRC